jgi:7-cyano-7-deazaguanine synthase in queuosine biosynthesis
VATYSGEVRSLAEISILNEESVKPYLFQLISGPTVSTNYAVYPDCWASAGYFMNHADGKLANVKTFIALHISGPLIVMQASKKIRKDQELLYNYNAEHSAYDTNQFD